jgi:hypothetical protein
MPKLIPLYQLIISFGGLLIVLVTSWVNINTRITALEISQKNDDNFRFEMRAYFKELNNGQTKILIQLENKKNRE